MRSPSLVRLFTNQRIQMKESGLDGCDPLSGWRFAIRVIRCVDERPDREEALALRVGLDVIQRFSHVERGEQDMAGVVSALFHVCGAPCGVDRVRERLDRGCYGSRRWLYLVAVARIVLKLSRHGLGAIGTNFAAQVLGVGDPVGVWIHRPSRVGDVVREHRAEAAERIVL